MPGRVLPAVRCLPSLSNLRSSQDSQDSQDRWVLQDLSLVLSLVLSPVLSHRGLCLMGGR